MAHSIPAVRVIEVLERLNEERGPPEVIMTDNGSEFTSRAFDAWAYSRCIRIDYIQPGKPVQSAFIESFNGTFRDECLNLHWFLSLGAAKHEIETWRMDYNQERPHSSLGRLTPAEFAGLHQQSEESLAISSRTSHEDWIKFGGHLKPGASECRCSRSETQGSVTRGAIRRK